MFPLEPSGLTPDWLTAVLQEAGYLGPTSTCSGADVEVLGGEAGAGITGQVARVRLAFDGPRHGPSGEAPESLIAKLSSADADARRVFRDLGRQEAWFYGSIAPASDVRAPTCFFSAFDEDTDAHLFLLEDFADWDACSWTRGADLETAGAVLAQMAAFHARWWMRPEVERAPATLFRRLSEEHEFIGRHIEAWPAFRERESARLDPRVVAVIDAAIGRVADIRRAVYFGDPRTLIHWDVQLDNVFVRRKDSGELDVAIIDWAGLGPAKAPYDMAVLLGGNLRDAVVPDAAKGLLRSYHDQLVAEGVQDYGFDACLRDFRLSLLDMLLRTMYAAMFFDVTEAQREGFHATALPRYARSVEAFDALDALATLGDGSAPD